MARTVAPKKGAAESIVSLKITLKGTNPPVWRRLLFPGSMTLGALSEAILTVMGWDGSHLHAFDIDGRRYGDPATTDDVADEERRTLNDVLKSGVKRFGYNYDFGDDWEHVISVEKTSRLSRARATQPAWTASFIALRRTAARLGLWRAFGDSADPNHPGRQGRLEWIGEDFDPEEFDVSQADQRLAARFKRK